MKAHRIFAAVLLAGLALCCNRSAQAAKPQSWKVGTPITTYYAGPALDEIAAAQMKEGGFNLVWAHENEIATATKYKLRFFLHDGLLAAETMEEPAKVAKLDALIERVKKQPYFYGYYIIDEPSATTFPGLGKLVAHLHAKDPAHMAYINLFPTYANNDQLGNKGDTVTAYKEYLKQFVDIVKPEMLSYDHYHFTVNGDNDQYFLNLAMIRQAGLDAKIPFLNIIQGCTWDPGMRAPNADEMRWLNYTTLAYGGQGISYFVYSYGPFYDQFKEKAGQMMRPDGSPTAQYDAARRLNPQFVAIASQLQPLQSLGAYHSGKAYWGADNLPEKAPFHLDFSVRGSVMPQEGMLLGYFGKAGKPTHALVVNLSYKTATTTTVVGPGRLSVFDLQKGTWKRAEGAKALVTLAPGGGVLVKID